ncbi:MAG: competence type IV pilus ATPase ComGA [Candidatus Kurthia intestinigallinarum]
MSIIEQQIEQQAKQLLQQAMLFQASDVLFLPNRERYDVYFRKFHQLFHMNEMTIPLATRFISFFKFEAALDIGDQRKPQSGAFQMDLEQERFACRVSTLPSAFSHESLILRMMYHHEAKLLDELGVFEQSIATLYELPKRRQGLVFMTGPTGSGKSTTLYSLVQQCAVAEQKQVISLEDPVEHPQAHLLQVQVNERAGVTYEVGLKAILRHSPDVMMIGEIRDKVTAKIAIEAALTGHLVFSTIHAKDSVGCIYRLLDLGISKEDLRQTLLAIIAQRLVPIKDEQQQNVRALFEILDEQKIHEVLADTGHSFQLPYDETLQGQYERGIRDGRILCTTNLQ